MKNTNASQADLLARARAARAHAYAPYSSFTVGAALRCADGSIIDGCNVENASYGLAMCAERVAIGAAVAQGKHDFVAIAVAGPDGVTTAPCGACRQVLVEFNPSMLVVYTTPSGQSNTTAGELLPEYFGPHALP